MPFQPTANSTLEIDSLTYRVAEHPAAPGVAYGQEGRAAIVYQVVDQHGTAWALKVFRPRFRVPALVNLAGKLANFADIPGLSVCRRTVLTSRKHTELLRQYPDLTYAVLMPWVYGPTWMQVVLEQQPFTPEQSLRLAHALLHLLAEMEERGLAHCDLSGPNLILPALAANVSANTGSEVALVDVEQMFGPDLSKPEILPGGSAGYAHKTAPAGLWASNADRFAGAVLLAEMLGWCDERVRRSASGESYFAPEEMQRDSTRYQRMVTSLHDYWGVGVANLFEHAWHSETLGDCPTFGEWLVTLPQNALSLERAETEAESPLETVAVEEPLPNPETDHEFIHKIWPEADYQRAQALAGKESIMAAELQPIIRDPEAQLHPSQLQPQTPLPPQTRAAMPTDWISTEIVVILVGLALVLIVAGLLWWQISHNTVRLTAEAGTAIAVPDITMTTAAQDIAIMATEQAQFISTTTARAHLTETAITQAQATATAYQIATTATEQAQQTATSQAQLMSASTERVHRTETAIAQSQLTATAQAQSTTTARVRAIATAQAGAPTRTQQSTAPVITNVQLRNDTSSGSLVIWQDIYFSDADGDANLIDYELLATTASSVTVVDGPIQISSQGQRTGALISGKWVCGGGSYSTTLRAVIRDRAGQSSNPVEYTLNCQ